MVNCAISKKLYWFVVSMYLVVEIFSENSNLDGLKWLFVRLAFLRVVVL